MNLSAQIEALLFFKGEPMTVKKIAEALAATAEEVDSALGELETALKGRGISVIRNEGEVELRTSPEAAALIEKITKDELSKDLGKAGLETLSLILYKGPVKRSEIDYIRGVSSQYIVRSLLVRGLIQRDVDPNDSRSVVYSPSMDTLAMLGVTKKEDLPEFAAVQEEWNKQQASLEENEPTPVAEPAPTPDAPQTN